MAYSLGRRGRLPLIRIEVLKDSKDIAQALRNAGLKITATQVQKNLEEYKEQAMTAMTEQAIESIREAIPKDSGELSETHVDFERTQRKVEIFIDEEDHTQYGRKAAEVASSLAEWLNLGGGRGSRGIRRGGEKLAEDKDWIGRAQSDFKREYKGALKRRIR